MREEGIRAPTGSGQRLRAAGVAVGPDRATPIAD